MQALVGPSIESGIAAQASLMHLLEAHTEALRETGADQAQLEAAELLLSGAQSALLSTEHRPRAHVAPSSSSVELALPVLRGVMADAADLVDLIDPQVAGVLEAQLAVKLAGSSSRLTAEERLVVNEVHRRLMRGLESSRYYRGDVKDAVDLVLTHLLRFWYSRAGQRASKSAYLFRSDVLEEALADDLKLFFDGNKLMGVPLTEVRDVGGGRVDVAVPFTGSGFTLYIELKRDARNIDITDMHSYVAQAGAYQFADVPIGFLALLDLRRRTGPPLHMTTCFDLVVLDDASVGEPRYVPTMVVPGNRREPSAMR